MILEGNQRGGGQKLAAHLMNEFDNDHVEVAEVRGTIAQDLSGSFAEIAALGRSTKIEHKYYYHLSLSPDPAQGRITREQYYDLISRTERSLGLVGQPRAVVFHVKYGREHGHVVWSRVDTSGAKFKAINISHDSLKLATVIRSFCRDHGLRLPPGMEPVKSTVKGRDDFNVKANEDLGERQQKERSGISKEERKADIVACWRETSNGEAFVQAMQTKGYYLGRGNQRDYVVLDLSGDVHSLSRQLSGTARKREFMARLESHPPDKLRGVDELKAFLQQKREDAIRRAVMPKEASQPSAADARRQALQEQQKQRRANLDLMRDNLLGRHQEEREGLKVVQRAENEGVAEARQQRQPKGVMAFLTRVTGVGRLIAARQRQKDKARDSEHKRQSDIMERMHGRELADIERRSRALTRLETRETKSLEISLKREEFQLHVLRKPPQSVLRTDFDKVIGLQIAGRGGNGGATAPFRQAAQVHAMTRGDLQKAFERAHAARAKGGGDGGEEGQAPVSHNRLDEARQIRDDLAKRKAPSGPDKDRER